VNVDFADVRTIMQNGGPALMGTGMGRGENRAMEAAQQAISSPLLDNISIAGATGVLINITGGDDLTLGEVTQISEAIHDAAGGLAAVALLWASRDAWPWRRPLTAAPIVVSSAYVDSAVTLGKRETFGQLLQRAGITGRDYTAFLTTATALQPRRMRPGLVF